MTADSLGCRGQTMRCNTLPSLRTENPDDRGVWSSRRDFGSRRSTATGRTAEALRSVADLGADVIIPLVTGETLFEDCLKDRFVDGVDVVMDYLWESSAEQPLIAGAKAGGDDVPISFGQIGAVSGAEITLPSAVLRSNRPRNDGLQSRQHPPDSSRSLHRGAATGDHRRCFYDCHYFHSSCRSRNYVAKGCGHPAHGVHYRSVEILSRSRGAWRSGSIGCCVD
jgi:hypothetical protein